MVPFVNAGLKLPLLKTRLPRVATDEVIEAARLTVMGYDCVVVPFCAVTTVVIVLLPTFKGTLAEAEPEVTAVPFTFTVAVVLLVVGVTVMLLMLFATFAV